MANYPASDFATALGTGAVTLLTPPGGSVTLTYATGGNLTIGPLPAQDATVAALHVAVLQTGGPPPAPYLGAAPNENIRQARVQAMVRGALDSFSTGEALARGLQRKMHLAVLSGYIDCRAQESEPNYLGADERGLHSWSVNFLLRWKD